MDNLNVLPLLFALRSLVPSLELKDFVVDYVDSDGDSHKLWRSGYRCTHCNGEWRPLDARNESVYPYRHDCTQSARIEISSKINMAQMRARYKQCPIIPATINWDDVAF